MDSTDLGSSEAKSDDAVVVGEKRSVDDGGTGCKGDEESGIKTKKTRNGGLDSDKEMRRIAEMVLVLSAMGNIRGGKEPSAAEKALMSEARKNLVSICEELAPKDIIPVEAVGSVIQDLGLNRSKDNRLAMGSPKFSIVQKMDLAQRKMAEPKAFAAQQQSGFPSQKLQTGMGGESCGTSANVRAMPVNKSGHAVVSAGNFQAVAPNASSAASLPLPSQPSTHAVQPAITSMGLPSNNVRRDSTSTIAPRIIHFQADGRPNGPSYVPSVPGNQHATRTVAPHLQHQPPISSNAGTKSKVPDQLMAKPDGKANLTAPEPTPQTAHLQTAKPVVTQGTPGTVRSMPHSITGVHFVHTAPAFNHHLEISKLVQKLLLPQPAERSTWTAPSRDYMNKTLTCLTCKMTVNDVESLLVCDACEKGTHLRCLGVSNQKGIPRGEWHCPKCLSISHGKPFPPKYGRVTRNVKSPKLPSNTAGSQSSLEKKQGVSSEQQMTQRKVATVRSSDEKHASHTSAAAESSSESKISHLSGVYEIDVCSAVNTDVEPKSKSCPNSEAMGTRAAYVSPSTGSLSDRPSTQVPAPESWPIIDRHVNYSKSKSSAKPLSVTGASHDDCGAGKKNDIDQVGVSNDSEALLGKEDNNSGMSNDLYQSDMKGTVKCDSSVDVKHHNQSDAQEKSLQTAADDSKHGPSMLSKGSLRNVVWIGDVHRVVDEKKYYQSCSIDGVRYRVLDYVLCRSNDGRLKPSKLQAMWEDNQTGLKWVIVNLCYFPGDLPEGVGHPCSPDSNEVYESNCQSTLRADLIEGHCDVCPPKKFGEENNTVDQMSRSNVGAQPIFVCKWFYDEIRRVFRPIPA